EFADLQRLLTLSFVNPNGAISIQNLDSSCDTSQKRLQPLDANALDRIHRFLRLWRKLGWNMWEVDLVIQHPALGNSKLDANFVLQLYPFLQIKNKLSSLSVEQLGAFWPPSPGSITPGDINTQSKFIAAYQAPAPSLYENLFLNKRLTNPIDSAFAVSAVTAANPGALFTDPAHIAPILAATRVKQTDLTILEKLTKPANGPAYLTDSKLSLKNLSFLYRHALLARTLRIRIQDWETLLFLVQQDVFKDPPTTLAFLKLMDRIQASGFSIDQLNYILTADLTPKSAVPEKTITPILAALAKSLQAIAKANNSATMSTSASDLSTTIGTQLQTLGWDATSISSLIAVFNNQIQLQRSLANPPAGFDFPAAITNQIKIGYDKNAHTISFTGVMSDADQTTLLNDPTLAAVTGNPSYQRAINDIHDMPRLLMKFYLPYFTASLPTLPAGVQFGTLPSKDLAAKIQYNPDRQELSFFGIMSTDDQDALNALSAVPAYRAAVLSLFNQPRGAAFSPSELWLTLAMLLLPLDQNLAANLLTAEQGLARYVGHKQSTDQVIQQLSAALGLTQAITEYFMTNFTIFPAPPPNHTLLPDFLDPNFINASSAITSTAFPELYQGYYWLHRTALVLKTLAIKYADLLWIQKDKAQTGVLDFGSLPLVYNAAVPPATLLPLINLSDFMQLHHAYSDDSISLLDVVDRLINDAAYNNVQFGSDAESLAGWTSADVQALTAANAISIVFPADYAKADAWQRLKKAFSILQRLNASSASALALANPVLGPAESASLKQMLRSKY
ncbi:MAG TPA: hypothetical protein VN872_01440, partial [Candidatus Acidoferrum sp.]|nr:hypothetical protein [Candidatus Acidoferrum sp.]